MQNKTCATNECGKLISLMQSEKNLRMIKEKKTKKTPIHFQICINPQSGYIKIDMHLLYTLFL